MTARDTTRVGSDNSGGSPTDHNRRSDTDVQIVTRIIDNVNASIDIDDLHYSQLHEHCLRKSPDQLQNKEVSKPRTGITSGMIRLQARKHPVRTDGGSVPFEPTADLQVSDIFEVLADGRRRDCIQVLVVISDNQRDEYIEAADVATIIAGVQTGKPRAEISSDAREREYVALVQNHLPKLDEYDVIDFYERPKKIALTDAVHVMNGILLAVDQITDQRQTRLEKIAEVIQSQ